MVLENMHARVRRRIQGNGSQRDNIFIFKRDREEGKRTAGMHEGAGGTGFETATSQQTVPPSVIHPPAGTPFTIIRMNPPGG
jgi:hypothetical protein